MTSEKYSEVLGICSEALGSDPKIASTAPFPRTPLVVMLAGGFTSPACISVPEGDREKALKY